MKDISVILPCLNEEQGIGICLDKIFHVFSAEGLDGEIIVVDNGCTDNTVSIVKSFNDERIKIVYAPKKGYGNAYLAGFKEVSGKVVVMGDADNTYDFYDIPRFLESLKDSDVVLGSRFKGKMEKGAMPSLHRYVGSPMFVFIMNNFHGLKISEPSTGYVAIRKEALDKLNLKQPGMEFASEFLIKSQRAKLRIKEIPINYAIRFGDRKLRTFRDGFRHLGFMTKVLVH